MAKFIQILLVAYPLQLFKTSHVNTEVRPQGDVASSRRIPKFPAWYRFSVEFFGGASAGVGAVSVQTKNDVQQITNYTLPVQ